MKTVIIFLTHADHLHSEVNSYVNLNSQPIHLRLAYTENCQHLWNKLITVSVTDRARFGQLGSGVSSL